jgi:hypothetical protein
MPILSLGPRRALNRDTSLEQGDFLSLLICKDVALRASMLMDGGDANGLAALFIEHLEFVKPSTYPEISIRGRDQLRKLILGRPSTFVSRHVCTNAIADQLSPDKVRVRSYFLHFSHSEPNSSERPPMSEVMRSLGEYEDLLVKDGERWLIARRTGRFVFGGI